MARHNDITVIIPCFNHGRFLLESVERALGQEGGPPKVMVVDDGSTHAETLRTLDEVPNEVEVIRQENAGVAAARNAGFENSDSELLLMVDADDRLTSDALDRSEEHTSELQSLRHLVCRHLLEKKKRNKNEHDIQ